MMRIPNNFCIKCNECGNVTLVIADDLDYETSVYDRPMGEEIEYDSECHGGCFIDEPVVEMDYEFDFDYYDEAYAEYERAEYFLEYNREKIKRMSPRDFEFFVADIFEKLGFSVKITQATRDGGKDIIATKADPIPYTLIIECKHWGENHKVDVSVVRSV